MAKKAKKAKSRSVVSVPDAFSSKGEAPSKTAMVKITNIQQLRSRISSYSLAKQASILKLAQHYLNMESLDERAQEQFMNTYDTFDTKIKSLLHAFEDLNVTRNVLQTWIESLQSPVHVNNSDDALQRYYHLCHLVQSKATRPTFDSILPFESQPILLEKCSPFKSVQETLLDSTDFSFKGAQETPDSSQDYLPLGEFSENVWNLTAPSSPLNRGYHFDTSKTRKRMSSLTLT